MRANRPHHAKLPHMKIMIVEDHEDFRDLMIRALARHGMVATGFSSVESAQAFFETTAVDAVVTDVTLREPEDGLELVRWVKGHQRTVPVLVVTGSAHIHARARDAGAAEVLVKPVTVSVLADALRRMQPVAN